MQKAADIKSFFMVLFDIFTFEFILMRVLQHKRFQKKVNLAICIVIVEKQVGYNIDMQ